MKKKFGILKSLINNTLAINKMLIKKIFFVIIFFNCLSISAQTILNADEFDKKLKASKDAQVLDVRTKGEYSENHLANSYNADYNNLQQFNERIKFLDKNKPVFVYCLAGGRSAEASKILNEQGFKEVYDLKGGMRSWMNSNKDFQEGSSKTKKVGISELDYHKLLTGNKLVLVDFNAKWCPPCKKMAPELDEISKQQSGKFNLLKLDVDENTLISKSMKIEALPVLILYKNGKEIWKHEGYLDKKSVMEILEKNK